MARSGNEGLEIGIQLTAEEYDGSRGRLVCIMQTQRETS